MKYLIVKGWLGFGDRLESLKMGVKYAIDNNLQIYVDWRDPMWSHGSEDFYTYFKLVNMPVLNSLADIPEDATYFPAFWKGNLNDNITYDYIQTRKDENINIGMLDKPFDADVVVFSSCGYRMLYNDSAFFANVFRVIDPRILTKIQYHKSRKPLAQSWGVHIRGTDHVKDKSRHISIQSIVSYFTTMGGMNVQNIVAVSDDVELLTMWKRYYPVTYVVSEESLKSNSLAGFHNAQSKDKLTSSKDSLNVDLLVDFFVLSSCGRIFSTIKGSRFAAEARRLQPVVGQILNGI